ncbi:MAG: hypothetical protein KJ771_08585 [Nanoarchaeota archaeon]|nr:hypothetical protein [Nanoarchaeota archaeon]
MTTTFYSEQELETITAQLLGKVLDADNVVEVLKGIKQKYLSEHDFKLKASLDPVNQSLSSNLISYCTEVERPLGQRLFEVHNKIEIGDDTVNFSETLKLNLQSLLFAREFGPYVNEREYRTNSPPVRTLAKTLAKRARLPKDNEYLPWLAGCIDDALKYDQLKQGKYAFLFIQLKENSQVGYEEPGGPWPLSEEILHPPKTGNILMTMFNDVRDSKGIREFHSWRSRTYDATKPDKLTLLVHNTIYRFAMPEIETIK